MQLRRGARDLFNRSESTKVTTDTCRKRATYYGITVDDLKSPRRNHEITVPRQIAMFLTPNCWV
jgi:chromosomal replication initiation ATPase DnaA